MKIYTVELTCSICGGAGVGTMDTAGKSWIKGTELVHTDPSVCRDNLKKKKA